MIVMWLILRYKVDSLKTPWYGG